MTKLSKKNFTEKFHQKYLSIMEHFVIFSEKIRKNQVSVPLVSLLMERKETIEI